MGSTSKTFKDLIVWQKAHALVLSIYKMTVNLPREELYGLTSQIRRAAVSIPANIAEGSGRKTTKDYVHFLYISKGSLLELETLLEVALVLGYIKDTSIILDELKSVRNLLVGLISSLERKL